MVDVTARFNAYLGWRQPMDFPVSDSEWIRFLQDSSGLLYKLSDDSLMSNDELSSAIARFEHDIEVCEFDPQKRAVCKQIVGILYEALSKRLVEVQSRDLEKINRESAIRNFFSPEGGLVKYEQPHEPPNAYEPLNATADAEAAMLLVAYQSDADQVVSVRRHLQETSALLSLLSTKAVEQSDLVGSILHAANDSIGHVEFAEEQLKKAAQHNSSYRFYIVSWFMCLTFVLLVMDFIM